ncbi:MAG TPA: phosphoribosylformylglycinamidine synthase I [archaeon]|nr:phosphoribosylformylglycinamidine synthase I [archaeon]
MNNKGKKVLVLRSPGTNCDYEASHAMKRAGAEVTEAHINSLLRKEIKLIDYQMLFLPGGFSYGDYLGSAKILANKLTLKLGNELKEFIKEDNLVIGICNGFQVLVKAGLLPGNNKATLTFNDSGSFICKWVELKNVNKGKCIFSKGIDSLRVPIAHGEGKFVPENAKALKELYDNDQVVFKYRENPNGSVDDIAGICDETGRVFGLMPHPERNQYGWQDPISYRKNFEEKGEGFKVFENAVSYLSKKKL